MYKSIWFNNLNKPFLNPPSWVFKPVWAILYLMMLASLIIFATSPSTKPKFKGYLYFTVQLLLNLSWSPAFFALENIKLGFLIIILLDIFVLLTIFNFYKVSKISAYLLVPYFIWILFATYLNFAYLILN